MFYSINIYTPVSSSRYINTHTPSHLHFYQLL